MTDIYVNAPLHEAVCEFRFLSEEPWDPAFPGIMYERMREQFPKHRPATALETSIVAQRDSIEHRFAAAPRSQFLRDDERALVQVGPNLLAVNVLRPYPGWSEFRPLLLETLRVYRDVVNPAGLERVGLRYINRIVVATDAMQLGRLFQFYPYLGEGLRQEIVAFIVGVHVLYDDERDALRMQLTDGPGPEPEQATFTLDLEYFLNRQGELGFDGLESWLDHAHSEISGAFENSVTDDLRVRFNKEESDAHSASTV